MVIWDSGDSNSPAAALTEDLQDPEVANDHFFFQIVRKSGLLVFQDSNSPKAALTEDSQTSELQTTTFSGHEGFADPEAPNDYFF